MCIILIDQNEEMKHKQYNLIVGFIEATMAEFKKKLLKCLFDWDNMQTLC